MTRDLYENNATAGVVIGLAWTAVGGDILFIESALSKGKGQLSITGNLGKIMKESSTIAMEYIKANARRLGLADFLLINTTSTFTCQKGLPLRTVQVQELPCSPHWFRSLRKNV